MALAVPNTYRHLQEYICSLLACIKLNDFLAGGDKAGMLLTGNGEQFAAASASLVLSESSRTQNLHHTI